MSKKIEARVKETSTTTGTGNFTLAGASTGFRAFSSACSVGDLLDYVIDGGTEWETGVGIYSAANTLQRLIPIRSTNANAAVNFSAGTKTVWLDAGQLTLKFRPENGFFASWQQTQVATGFAGNGMFHAAISGGSFSASPATAAGIVGGVTLGLGTTTTARAALISQNASSVNNFVALGSGVAHWKSAVKITTLSDGTNTYTARTGITAANSGEAGAGVYFRYTDSVNAGKWQAVTRQNNTETAADTGVTAQTTSTSIFEIYVNAAATSAYFFIDGVLVATNTTNIPSGTGSNQPVGYGTSGHRSAGTASLSPIDIYFMQFEYFYSTPF